MKIKLSYTVDLEEVRPESAFLLANMGPTITDVINLYNVVVEDLRGGEFDAEKLTRDTAVLRNSLAAIDLRLGEVEQIVLGTLELQEASTDEELAALIGAGSDESAESND